MDKVDEFVKKTNERLKKEANPLRIIRRKGTLYCRGTLPPKPLIQTLEVAKEILHTEATPVSKQRQKQQKFSLQLPSTVAGVRSAYRILAKIGPGVRWGEFDWLPWMRDPVSNPHVIGYWVDQFEAHFWRKRADTSKARNTWRAYRTTFNRLDYDQPMSQEELVNTLATIPADTASRRSTCNALVSLARFAGLETDELTILRGSYTARSVTPRNLPSDFDILALQERFSEPWGHAVFFMIVYGLRNHEVFHMDLSDWPTVWIGPGAKTGERFIYPMMPEWVEGINPHDLELPNLLELKKPLEQRNNQRLGKKVGRAFGRAKTKIKPYDLRHCYARRCFENGLGAELTAKLMGHSLAVQTQTYRAWWGEDSYKQSYLRALNRTNDPIPSNVIAMDKERRSKARKS